MTASLPTRFPVHNSEQFIRSTWRSQFPPVATCPKDENGTLRVPYSKGHIEQTPEVGGGEGISDESERKLRDHFGIDTGDQELRKDNNSYATLVPEGDGTAELARDPDGLQTPNADKRDEETNRRLHDPGPPDTRAVDAGAIADQNAERSPGVASGGSAQSD